MRVPVSPWTAIVFTDVCHDRCDGLECFLRIGGKMPVIQVSTDERCV